MYPPLVVIVAADLRVGPCAWRATAPTAKIPGCTRLAAIALGPIRQWLRLPIGYRTPVEQIVAFALLAIWIVAIAGYIVYSMRRNVARWDEPAEPRHPAAGMRILARQPDFRFVIPYVLFHHEHWNGGGYPFGRRGDEIPLEARVLAVADAFDAMTSPRPYGPPLPVNEAVAEIDRCAGTQFDPLVAGVFVELCRAASPRLLAAQG